MLQTLRFGTRVSTITGAAGPFALMAPVERLKIAKYELRARVNRLLGTTQRLCAVEFQSELRPRPIGKVLKKRLRSAY